MEVRVRGKYIYNVQNIILMKFKGVLPVIIAIAVFLIIIISGYLTWKTFRCGASDGAQKVSDSTCIIFRIFGYPFLLGVFTYYANYGNFNSMFPADILAILFTLAASFLIGLAVYGIIVFSEKIKK